MRRIQQLILALSNAHQITACPTSLPLPIFIAHETAKRGLNVYNEVSHFKTSIITKNHNKSLFNKNLTLQ